MQERAAIKEGTKQSSMGEKEAGTKVVDGMAEVHWCYSQKPRDQFTKHSRYKETRILCWFAFSLELVRPCEEREGQRSIPFCLIL